jgi:hypothetical protein
MPGLLDYLNNALGLLNRVGPMGTLVPSQMRQASLGDFLRSANDTAQGVSRGMSADLLGAPVDITAQLMTVPRYLGAQTPDFTQSPVGGSQWFGQKMESMGLLRPPTNSADEMAGRVLGGMLATPSVVGAVGSTAERGLLAAGQNAMIPNRMSPQAGAIVWHGSPHKFDKFDSSKIGTGEGKQQQGVGSYLADLKDVGQRYADKEAAKRGMNSGYLYKVDMPDSMIDSMASYDAPLSAQPEGVRVQVLKMLDRDALTALKNYHGWTDPQDAPFAAIMDALEISRGNNRAAVSESLRAAGIPGIRYLDGGSRGAGDGTRNYVVFPGNEDLLKILERQ